jgi:formylglycine-generating enzyme required for sulfatase activity
VSVGEYRRFIHAGGYREQRSWTAAGWVWREIGDIQEPEYWNEPKWSGDKLLPVVGVSWYEAMAFCRWLGESCRLPTEAEWEKAARGTDDRIYPWGDDFDTRLANTRLGGLNKTEPIGQRSPGDHSPYGVAEMAGNVSDWTLSQFKPYPYDQKDGRNEIGGEVERVIRGGSWFKPVLRARVSARGMNDPYFRDNDVGFRTAYIIDE